MIRTIREVMSFLRSLACKIVDCGSRIPAEEMDSMAQEKKKTESPAGTQSEDEFVFPEGFVWGTGTSSYQVEGAWNVDGKGESIWDRFSHTPGKVKNGDTGDVACDHYNRFAEDILLAKRLNLNSYRFSIAWPRLQPNGRGEFNQHGLDFYDRIVDACLENGITPFITLYHWDLPQALEDEGGWGNREVCELFAAYAAKCVERYGDRVKHWTTFNEPWCTSFLGYESGYHAPGKKDPKLAAQVAHNLLVAHGLAAQAMRKAAKKPIEVGIVLNLSITEPFHADDPEDVKLAEAAWRRDCGAYLDPLYRGTYPADHAAKIGDLREGDLKIISQRLDFLGINFYSRGIACKTDLPYPIPGSGYTAMGWEVSPWALRGLLSRIYKEYGAKLYVTENGAAYDDVIDGETIADTQRLDYIREHVRQVALTIKEGTPVHGYFAWSLMDNFEWAEGYSRRFGIVYVDFETQKRTVKDSGHWFANAAKQNRVALRKP
ncbi:MAG TPA: GH1 family beta-glucosidase [Candidatus Melainabacteria bacterium]|nr:GH1 family beta-glucosidase [Candidatus Melainabacteria bacterium]